MAVRLDCFDVSDSVWDTSSSSVYRDMEREHHAVSISTAAIGHQ